MATEATEPLRRRAKATGLAATGCLAWLLALGGPAQPARAGSVIAVDLAEDTQVSLAVYDAAGRMVRELRRAAPQPAGRRQFGWDGLDMDGVPAPPGTYEWRLLTSPGLRSEYLLSLGTSIGPQWWPGNHGGPGCLAAAVDSFVVAAATEGPPEIIRCTFDGKVVWMRGSFEPARAPRDVAIADGRVYYLQDSGKVQVLDFASGASLGQPLSGLIPVRTLELAGLDGASAAPQTVEFELPNGDYFLRFRYGDREQATALVEVHPGGLEPWPGHRTLADKMRWWQLPATAAGEPKTVFLPQIYGNPRAVPVRDGRLRIEFLPQTDGQAPVHWRATAVDVLALPDCLAAAPGLLVLASAAAEAVVWCDPATGETIDRLALGGVRDLALAASGSVLALLPDRVVRFSRTERTPKTVVPSLEAPAALALEPVSGDLLILAGDDVQQVHRHAADGRPLATIGTRGGRAFGRYVATDLQGVTALAADGQGGFLLAEGRGVPRRTVRFDAAGRIVREWFGGMDFYVQTHFDPDDPTLGWLRHGAEHVVQVRIDYQARTWYPLAAWRWTEALDPAPERARDPLYATRFEYGPWLQRNPSYLRMRCLRRDLDGDGRRDLLLEFTGMPLLLVHDEAGERLRPLAALGMLSRSCWAAGSNLAEEQLPAAWAEAIRRAGGDPADLTARPRYARYVWADEDGDGRIAAAELRLGPAHRDASSPAAVNGGFCLRIDENLTAWISDGDTRRAGLYGLYRAERYTACGAPVWPLQGAPAGPLTSARGASAALLPAGDGGAFLALHGNGDGVRASGTYDVAVHGWSWPSTMTDGVSLWRLDAEHRPLWRVSTKAARWPHPRGQLHGPHHLGGPVNDCLAVFDWLEQPCEFWTADGLYVGGLFDGRDPHDGRLPGGAPDPLYTWHGIKAKRIGANGFAEHSLFAADDLRTGGDVARLADGSVVFVGQGGNNNPCYRITGWDRIRRQSGPVTVTAAAPAPPQNGSGLSASYFAAADLSGDPLLTRTDARVWFGHQHPWPDGVPAQDFSVCWSGFLEPRFSEDYCLSVYARGEFRLWLDGREVEWGQQDYPRDRDIRKGHSVPLPLTAGRPIAIRLEYRGAQPLPACHLNWESLSQPVEHIPAAALYPAAEQAP
jgi:hypothetical protein